MGYADLATSPPPSAPPWPIVPLSDALPAPGELAGFDTLEQAMAVVAGLSGLEVAGAV